MTAVINRDRLAQLFALEEQRFKDLHKQSEIAFEESKKFMHEGKYVAILIFSMFLIACLHLLLLLLAIDRRTNVMDDQMAWSISCVC